MRKTRPLYLFLFYGILNDLTNSVKPIMRLKNLKNLSLIGYISPNLYHETQCYSRGASFQKYV